MMNQFEIWIDNYDTGDLDKPADDVCWASSVQEAYSHLLCLSDDCCQSFIVHNMTTDTWTEISMRREWVTDYSCVHNHKLDLLDARSK